MKGPVTYISEHLRLFGVAYESKSADFFLNSGL
jgi:hypothetical protein